VPLDVSLALAVEKNRVRIDSGRVSTGPSQAEFSGAIDSLTDFSGAFQYKVRASLGELTRTLGWRTQLEGPVTLAGKASFHGASDYQASGALHAAGVLFHPGPALHSAGLPADGAFNVDPRRIAVSGLRIEGLAMASLTGTAKLQPFPVSGRIESVVLRQKTLDAGGIHLDTGRVVRGEDADRGLAARARAGRRGGIRRAQGDARLQRPERALGWGGIGSGAVERDIGQLRTLQLAGHMAISPTGSGAPVRGSIDGTYDATGETLDLGQRLWRCHPRASIFPVCWGGSCACTPIRGTWTMCCRLSV
jgi:hypothetical protein